MRKHIDTRYLERDGVRYRIDIDPDPDASPDEFDCYDRDDIDGFRAGRWRYVTVTVTVPTGSGHTTAAHRGTHTGRPDPDTLDIEPTPSGYRGIAHIAHGEQAAYRTLADWLGTVIDAAETC